MKFNAAILFAAVQAVGVLSSAVSLDSSAPGNIQKRDCWHGQNYGCSESGFCWEKCGGDHTGEHYQIPPILLPPPPGTPSLYSDLSPTMNDGFGGWYT
ncbi:hypothetical protein DL768_008276 [Monosporascus sp. mg162]|nr:hypothetical protein DL768_008276 [Monosporascus sp. mg162]